MKVLACVDGSYASLSAIKKALPFLDQNRNIDLVYVIDEKFLAHISTKDKEKMIAFQQESAQTIIDKTTEFINSLDAKVEDVHILKGHPSTEIIKINKLLKPYMIIIGTNSKDGAGHWLGSVSREVIMNSACPIFIAQDTKKSHVFNKDVLVTVNDSECSYNAIKKMIEAVNLQNASIELMTVTYGPESIPSELIMDDNWLKCFMEKEREKAKLLLDKVKKHFEDNNIDVKDTFHLEGFVTQQIIDYLEENQKDLVVMGTHGRDEITSFLLGSVSRRVLDHSSSPILIVPNKKTN